MDEALPFEFEEKVKAQARRVKGVIDIDKCRIRKSGLDFFVEIHVIVNGAISVTEGHAIGHDVKHALMAASLNIADVTTHVEPAPA